jgi:hypothetical protein
MNINNIIKLIKAYFYENWQKDLYYSFAIAACLSLLYMAFGVFSLYLVLCFAVVMLVIYPTRVFGKLYQPSSRMQYLSLPASNNEKVVTNMLLVNIYYVIGMGISIGIGLLLGYAIGYVRDPELVRIKWQHITEAMSISARPIMLIYTSMAAMFFASIYFRKNPVAKMVLVGFVISLVLGAIMACTDWLNFVLTVPAEIRNGNYFKTEHYVTTSSNWFPYVASCVSIVYFYAMSFLRMKETEA